MNVALILAGGTGSRMHTGSIPKQFLEYEGKPIIIYTLEKFEGNKNIDCIVVVCIESWIEELKKALARFNINKVKKIVSGGKNGQESIRMGLESMDNLDLKSIVLVHDAVRPFIDDSVIDSNIEMVREKGNCITCSKATETVVIDCDSDSRFVNRDTTLLARAPQSFYLCDLLIAHKKARKDGLYSFVDSASLMNYYGHKMNYVIGPSDNIKITTPIDFFTFQAVVQAHNNLRAFGY